MRSGSRISVASSRCRAASPQPLALRYHGHQFQTYNPQLGDGRGFLFAQLHDLVDGRLLDLGTKGSGRTPWSRGGDGRLTLKGGVRELLASAMLEALGVDTSKTFSLIETGEELARNDEPSPTRSSVLVRLSHSHIRIGSFQRFAFHEDRASLSRLLDHTVQTYMADAWRDDEAARAVAFLERVCAAVAHGRRAVDGRGLRPWRAQHRQHQRHRRELRLRPVALPAHLRSRLHRGLLRRDRSLRLRPAADDAARGTSPASPNACCRWRRRRSWRRRWRPTSQRSSAALAEAMLARLGLRSGGHAPTAR